MTVRTLSWTSVGTISFSSEKRDGLLAQFCSDADRGHHCAHNHIQNCLKSFQAHLANVLLTEVMNLTRTWCTTQQEDLLEHATCISKVQPQLDSCMHISSNLVYHIYETADNITRIPRACCAMQPFENCTRRVTQDICSEETTTFLSGLYNNYARDLIHVACFEGSDYLQECGTLEPMSSEPTTTFSSPLPGLFGIMKLL